MEDKLKSIADSLELTLMQIEKLLYDQVPLAIISNQDLDLSLLNRVADLKIELRKTKDML